jgi:hypothetical protein
VHPLGTHRCQAGLVYQLPVLEGKLAGQLAGAGQHVPAVVLAPSRPAAFGLGEKVFHHITCGRLGPRTGQ